MVSSRSSLSEFLTGLCQRDASTRNRLRQLFLKPITQVVWLHARQHNLKNLTDRFVCNILSWLEMVFVSLPETKICELEQIIAANETFSVHDTSWETTIVLFGVVAATKHCLLDPFYISRETEHRLFDPTGLLPQLPFKGNSTCEIAGSRFESQWLLMPLEESSGDVADMMELNGALWVLLGDATGHGLLAHAVIDGVRHLWKVLLAQSHEGIDPLELFQKVDQRLQDCLPVGMFVEAILIRFSSDPYFTAAVAGYARLVLRRAGSSSVEICRLGSSYLGPVGEAPEEQMNFDFQPGDEVALATDGLFDHPYPDGTLIDGLQETLSGAISHVSLYQALVNSLEEAGRLCKQEDDVTLITIRKMSTTGGTYD